MEDGTDSPDTPAGAGRLPPNERPAPRMPATPYKSNVLFGGEKYMLRYSKDRAGDRFFITERSSIRKMVGAYPLTEDGWERAWQEFAVLEPESAYQAQLAAYQAQLANAPRDEWRKAIAQSLATMPDSTYLGGHGLPLGPGALYFLLFDDEGLAVVPTEPHGEPLAKVSYADIETMGISGRGN